MKHLLFVLLAAGLVTFSSCSQRLIDFTIISSKNVGFSAEDSKRTSGKSMKILNLGVNIKDAMDDALQNAGRGYDMLIDGVVRAKAYPFYGGYVVEGSAVKSSDIKLSMTDEEWKEFCSRHYINEDLTN